MHRKNIIIVSDDIYTDTLDNLHSMGYEVIFSYKNNNVCKYLSEHADMQIVNIGNKNLICAPECFNYYKEKLKKYSLNLIQGNTYLSCNYPDDIAYNIIVSEDLAIHNFKYTDAVLLSYIKDKKIINVSQGYTACTLCPVSENAFITADVGMYRTLISHGMDVLCISQGGIELPGFDYGFIGGASFMADKGTLAFNGCIEKHPDYNRIKEFCARRDVRLLSLSANKLMDIGSFVII